MFDIHLQYFAQAYGSDAYGGEAYQREVVGGETTTEVVAPSTGFFNSGPEILVPTILGLSVIIAVVVVAMKKRFRQKRLDK